MKMTRKVVKMKSKPKSVIMVLITLGIIFALSATINSNLIFSVVNSDKGNDVINLDNKNLRTSAISGKILINGNSGWASFKAAGNCTGNGIYSDPYVIEDLEIDGTGPGSGIRIENSDVYFKIENCTINNVPQYDAGIWLNSVENGSIINNFLSNNWQGITLDPECENNTIQGNTANGNTDIGIQLMESSNNYIKENTANNNGGRGINLETNSSYNDVVNNNANFNGWVGILLGGNSTNNLIMSNTLTNNLDGMAILSAHNTISDNTIESNAAAGIALWESSSILNADYNNITRNSIKYNLNGFVFEDKSSFNIIEGNQIIDNAEKGLEIISHFCSNNVIYNNTFINHMVRNAEDNGLNNNWSKGTLGNFWDDYSGADANDDGIGDTPYNIFGSADAQDNFPIWEDGPEPEPAIPGYNSFFLFGVLSVVAIVIGVKLKKFNK